MAGSSSNGWEASTWWADLTRANLTNANLAGANLSSATLDGADLTGVDWRQPSDRSRGQEIQEWFNKAAFAVNAPGTIGSGRRNQLRAPGFWNVDYSLFKNFDIVEGLRLQFRGEFFNLFNHTRLGAPNTTVTSPSFGRITSALDPRIVQLGLKVIF